MRKPELVYVVVFGADGPQIVAWQALIEDVHLCRRACSQGVGEIKLERLADNMATDEQVIAMDALTKDHAASTEHQAWCMLPLREVAYALLKARNLCEWDLPSLQSGYSLVTAYIETGQTIAAVHLATELLEISEQQFHADDPALAFSLQELGVACIRHGDQLMAKDVFERKLKIEEQHFGSDHLQVAKTLNILGGSYGMLGDPRAQKDMYERSLKIEEQHFGSDHLRVATTLDSLGIPYLQLGDHLRAKELWERC